MLVLQTKMKSSLAEIHSTLIKTKSSEFGFTSCGISKAEFLEEEAPHFEKWLRNNFHGEMGYMENYFDKRQSLLNQNVLLLEARDRLLPRLMSGEVEV